MFFSDPFCKKRYRGFQELCDFDWNHLRRPWEIGRWPLWPRRTVLAGCAVIIVIIVFSLGTLLSPKISVDEHLALQAMQANAEAARQSNHFAAVRNLDQRRRSLFIEVLLQNKPSEPEDITQTIDLIRRAAVTSGVQLHAVAPESVAVSGQAVLRIEARLDLVSLSMFWFVLSDSPGQFSISELLLEPADKSDFFKLSMDLIAAVATDVRPPGTVSDRRVTQADSAGVNARQIAERKGFLMRSGSSQLLYLVKDDKGRLRSVEE